MSRSAVSVLVFGIYLVVLGVVLIVAPNFPIGLFGIPETHEVWLRVAGFLVAAIGYYYLRAAREDARGFFRSTTHMRPLALPLFALFVWRGWAAPPLIAFAVVDLAGAAWTAIALRSDGRRAIIVR
jgi:uncharacterized membrane protein HdeD (DUF308 family)